MKTAEQALEDLKKGNANYVADKENVGTTDAIRSELTSGQAPYAIILSCADSRVIPESIFDANAGEIFVCRVAGNMLDVEMMNPDHESNVRVFKTTSVIMGKLNRWPRKKIPPIATFCFQLRKCC